MPELDLSLLLYGVIVGVGAGAVAGILAGLAGVGGGLIYMPVFYALMPVQHQGVAIQVFASLVAVVITGFFSARAHYRLGHIDKSAAQQLFPGLVMGAGLGLWWTLHLPEAWVLLALGGLDAWIAWDYGRKPRHAPLVSHALVWCSGPVGLISGTLGIGGGTMLVPLLRRFVALRFAVGTSALCGLIMALGAVVMNILLEPSWYDLLGTSWPFLLGAWLGIGMIMPTSSAWSARLHHVLPEPVLRLTLKTVFAALSAALLVTALLVRV